MPISTSDLDFVNIKNKLKTYYKQSGEFTDYDFEASGLSSILDVLAYNTHVNGLIANMAINESFITTAQLRTSVVNHAELLGYVPKSRTASSAEVKISVVIPNGPDIISLPKGTELFAQYDDILYSFKTPSEYTSRKSGDQYIFQTAAGSELITVYEGEIKTKNFLVGNASDDNVYVIEDATIDTDSMEVQVFSDWTGVDSLNYTNIDKVSTIDRNSHIFMLRESSNGFYEIYFGGGRILGSSPIAGNRIQIKYRSSRGAEPNGASVFSTAQISYLSNFYSVNVTTITPANGGSARETTSSIKLNAPRGFTSQQRLVTANDYSTLISQKFSPFIKDVFCWGGNDNEPPQYGKVFVSLNFIDGISEFAQETVKGSIKDNLTSKLSIMSIDTEFVDPETTYLELRTVFQVDQTKNISSVETLQALVNVIVDDFVSANLEKFNSTFRRSNLLTEIDNISEYIINSRMDVKLQQRIPVSTEIAAIESATGQLVSEITRNWTLNFPVILANPDNDDYIITSTGFKWQGQNVSIKNKLGSTRLQLVDLNNIVKIDNIGTYDPAKGKVSLIALSIDKDSYVGGSIKVSATPANQSTVKPLRNYVISLDKSLSTTEAVLDDGTTRVSL
jgi:hypothetical protein